MPCTTAVPNNVPKPLPRDFILLLISHFTAQSDTDMLCRLALLDRHTSYRVAPSLYKVVRLQSPRALVAFFGYLTGYHINRSRKHVDANEGEGGAGIPIGDRQSYLVGLIRHMEVSLDGSDMPRRWLDMVGKLQIDRILDRGFPNGIIDHLDTLHITSTTRRAPERSGDGTPPAESLEYAIAYILAKCSAAHIRHIDVLPTYSPRIDSGRHLIARIVNSKLRAGLTSFDSPLWSHFYEFDICSRRPGTKVATVDDKHGALNQLVDDVEPADLDATHPRHSLPPYFVLLHNTSDCEACADNRPRTNLLPELHYQARHAKRARDRGQIRLVLMKQDMSEVDVWRTWLEKRLWEDPYVGSKAWAEEQPCTCGRSGFPSLFMRYQLTS
jgi:hypothetical protein